MLVDGLSDGTTLYLDRLSTLRTTIVNVHGIARGNSNDDD